MSPLLQISLSTVDVAVAAAVAFVVAVAVSFAIAVASCFLLPDVAPGEWPPFELSAHWRPLTSLVVPYMWFLCLWALLWFWRWFLCGSCLWFLRRFLQWFL